MTLRVFFRTEALPPVHAIYAADLIQNGPGSRFHGMKPEGPLYLAGFLTEAGRDAYAAGQGFIVVPDAIPLAERKRA